MFTFIVLTLILGVSYFIVIFNRSKKSAQEIILVLLWRFVLYTLMFLISKKSPCFLRFYIFIAAAINFLYKPTYSYIIGVLLLVFMFTQLRINSKDFYYLEVQNAVDKVKSYENNNSVIVIYPYWADLRFMYYYNPNIFKNPQNFDDLLQKNHLIRVWGREGLINTLEKHSDNRIILYQDGKLEDESLFQYFDSTRHRIGNTFYPQCFTIGIFEPML